jgi:hypothetical protein
MFLAQAPPVRIQYSKYSIECSDVRFLPLGASNSSTVAGCPMSSRKTVIGPRSDNFLDEAFCLAVAWRGVRVDTSADMAQG